MKSHAHLHAPVRRRALVGATAVALLAACAPGPGGKDEDAEAPCHGGGRTVVFIGDSYTNGTEQDSGPGSRFPALLGTQLPAQIVVLASNGSGYTITGPAEDAMDFPTQAGEVPEEAHTVVVFGSRNDMHDPAKFEEIPAKVRTTLERIRDRAPEAEILVFGPPWVNPLPNDAIKQVNEKVAEGVKLVDDPKVEWIDTLEQGWFAEEDAQRGAYSAYISEEDKVHPNDEGHAYLADKMKPYLEPKVCGA